MLKLKAHLCNRKHLQNGRNKLLKDIIFINCCLFTFMLFLLVYPFLYGSIKIGSYQLYARGFIFLLNKYFSTLFAHVELQNSGRDTINQMITVNHIKKLYL